MKMKNIAITKEEYDRLKNIETEFDNLTDLAHENLPEHCRLEYDEVKFCYIRQGEGNGCKLCSNYK